MQLESHLIQHGSDRPGKLALVAGDTRLTYGDLYRLSRSLAAGLGRLGVGSGDRVVLLLDNGAEAVISFFAIWMLGGVVCPLHPSTKPEKLAGILASTDASCIITQGRLQEIAETAITAFGPVPMIVTGLKGISSPSAISFEELTDAPAPDLPVPSAAPEDLAVIIHTSGSTGTPKGVMHSHGSLGFACRAIVDYLGNTDADTVLSVLSLSFGYGLTQMLTMAMVGGTLVLERSFAFPRAILAKLTEERATGFPLVPTMAAMITAMRDLEPDLLPHLRYLTSAAAAMPPATVSALRTLLPKANIFLMYGQTECIRTSFLSPEEIADKPLSVGRALPGTALDVVDPAGQPVAAGETGELVIRGPHLMLGYWNDAAETARTLEKTASGLQLRTGDLFRRDQDGYLFFVARRDDMIKTRGEKVSPQEVERVLYGLEGVVEAAVEGVPDPILGQVVKAHVVVAAGSELTERMVMRHCAEHLEDFMVPKLVQFHDSLPKTDTGKIRLSARTETPSTLANTSASNLVA